MKKNVFVSLLFCCLSLMAQAQVAKYCMTYADFVADKWTPVDSLTEGRTQQAVQMKFADNEVKFKTGDKEADKIKKDADLRAEELQTAGRMEAGKIIGEAEQEATRIDAKANSFAPEFYSFWRSMQTLRNTLNGNATIVLRNDNEFFKMLFEEPNKGEAPTSVTAPVQPAPTP